MEEVEIRTKIDSQDKDEVISNLLNLGFVLKKKTVQHDIIFDKENAELFKSGCKIRLRIEDGKKELTYKGTMLGSSLVSKRTELNVEMNDVDTTGINEFLTALGFPMLFQIKKERLVYSNGEVEVCFDEWPIIGCLMEIEGNEEKIIKLSQNVAPKYIFDNSRLKKFFLDKMDETNKTLDQLINEYEKQTGFKLGNLALSLGL